MENYSNAGSLSHFVLDRISPALIAGCVVVAFITMATAVAQAQGTQARMELREARMDLRGARMDRRVERRQSTREIREARMDLRESIMAMEGVREARMEYRQVREARMDLREANMDVRRARMERNGERRQVSAERRRIRREARGRRWARVLQWNPSLANAPRPPAPMVAEARRHAWRVARLTRIRSLAMESENTAAVTRVDALLERENNRHERRVKAMTPGAESADGMEAPQNRGASVTVEE